MRTYDRASEERRVQREARLESLGFEPATDEQVYASRTHIDWKLAKDMHNENNILR